MKNILLIFCFCLSFLVLPAFGQDKNPIDVKEQACVDKAVSTIDISACMQTSYSEWDKELNKYYSLLMGTLSSSQKSDLLKAQKSWLVFRDNDFSFINNSIDKKDGTMFANVSIGEKKDIVKQRALRLKEYYLIMTDNYFNQPD